jgi:plasmid stabilization system protein ParE
VRVEWSQGARDEIARIYDYLATFSESGAVRTVGAILRRGNQIELFPESGRIVPEFEAQDVREVLEPPYRIVYRLTEEGAEVLAVRHGRRKMDRSIET